LSIPPALFVMDIFKIQLFAQAGIKLKSSWSLPPESLGLQVWAPSTQPDLFLIVKTASTSNIYLQVSKLVYLYNE
jgi:hypothetical protein